MGFLSRLIGGTKPTVISVAKSPAKVTRGSAANAPNVSKALPVPLRQPQQRQIAPPPVYKSTSDLPPHHALIASHEGGRFSLPTAMRQYMFILEIDGRPDTYAVVTTREHFGSAPYHGAIARITEAGARVFGSGIADGALVTRINKSEVADAVGEQDKPIIRDIEKLVQAALDSDVSDIHIESRGTGAIVRVRINGRLQKYSDSWDQEYVLRMARAMFTIADDDSKPTTFSSDCQMSVSRTLTSGARVKLRVQVSPAYPDDSMDIVIRVLRVAASAKVKSLESLGYAPDHIEMFEYMLASPRGLIVLSGTTGSGKTTTLQTLMQKIRLANLGRKLLSIEDPPEYVLDGVTQIPVPRPRDRNGELLKLNPFAAAMRNVMRMDPDVIMVGEIRDNESATLMVTMVQSGHEALTTIHTDSAPGIISRLRSMGVEADVMAGRTFISGLVYQTLVPKLCQHCRVDYEPSLPLVPKALNERIQHVIKPGDTLFIESDKGCSHCNHTGIAGRTVCAEILVPDDAIRDCILANDMRGVYKHWKAQRAGKPLDSMVGASALDHAILKMRRGEVSPMAIEGELGLLHDFSQEPSLEGIADNLRVGT